MTNSLATQTLRFISTRFLMLSICAFATCLFISCSDDDQESILEPDTYVYLITLI